MAAKQAAPGEALAAQINAMSRSEMYDMMSKMKVRPYPQSPNPTSPIPLSSLLSSAPLSTRRFVHRFALLFFTVFFYATALARADNDRPRPGDGAPHARRQPGRHPRALSGEISRCACSRFIQTFGASAEPVSEFRCLLGFRVLRVLEFVFG